MKKVWIDAGHGGKDPRAVGNWAEGQEYCLGFLG